MPRAGKVPRNIKHHPPAWEEDIDIYYGWTEIGEKLGESKQAVRYVAKAAIRKLWRMQVRKQ